MSISTGYTISASDINTVLTNINKTLTRYGISNISNISSGNTIYASTISTAATYLKSADSSSANRSINAYNTAITTNTPSTGELIQNVKINNLNSYATSIYNNYCGCNSHCSCNCDYCSCDCDYCRCDCNYCKCDSNCNDCGCICD